ncbi:restriction endonuclease subunit S [Shinella yambaruensis]|uniref:Type I restriction endonuclease n=1 Tax=Shinella yambaruensis TaxID=415996 RepID=A0ABQ5ZCD3_9HYPH|nr:restriction endonuclease subunit S [Shinella yambaruensis]MCJ8025882.1 restriction endonuclease subunit S [Shinella yambaruensis]MCU7978396.1 restriction endonuclease subunit S [Shinella yambaruensis]GLR50470.1 type I restriction endonuclease [Shinella yambaruensis]
MSYFAHSDELPDWAAKVPDGWGMDWLKWSVELSTKRPTESEQESLPYISNEDIASWTGQLLIEEPRPAEADSRVFQKDDVLFNKLRPYLAKVYHATFDGASSGELLCLRPSKVVEPRFLFYVLVSKGFIDAINSETFGSKMPRADWEIVGHQPLPLPPLETQQRIARFLDEKTARIDGLIEKKRALLDRLAEQRQALITRAVTKGLNPDAPMKSSGIDWLGDIPAHWEVLPLRRVLRSSTYGISASLEPAGGVAVLRMGNLTEGEIDFGDLRFLDDVDQNLMLEVGDVVFNRTNSLDLVGKAAIFRGGADFPVSLASYLVRFRFTERYLPEYSNFVMGTDGLLRLARTLALPSIGQANLNPSRYAQIEFPIPPVPEQAGIVSYLAEQIEKLRRVSERISQSLRQLTEYRAALITAAVTGQVADLA